MRKHSIFWGIILFGGGALLLLNGLGLDLGLGQGNEYGVVPLLGSVLLLAISIVSIIDLNFVMGFVPLSIIAYIWRAKIGVPDMNLWLVLLAAVLLGIGLSSIFWKSKRKKYEGCWRHRGHGEWPTAETISSSDESEFVSVDSTFGEHVKYVRSENLKKAQISSHFSSVKVYFDQCQVSPEGATIMVDCNFAGVFLYVPRTWNIDNQMRTAFGAVEGATLSSGDFTKITLTGDVHFGNVKIIYL